MTLARAQLNFGQIELAIDSFGCALQLDPTSAAANEELNDAQMLLVQRDKQVKLKLERDAQQIQEEIKREKDLSRAEAAEWYAKRAAEAMAGGEVEVGRVVDEEEDEEEDVEGKTTTTKGGYTQEEWERLDSVLSDQGPELYRQFQRELKKKREEDEIERRKEREEEVEDEDEDEDEKEGIKE